MILKKKNQYIKNSIVNGDDMTMIKDIIKREICRLKHLKKYCENKNDDKHNKMISDINERFKLITEELKEIMEEINE
jgi:hypothetical protein